MTQSIFEEDCRRSTDHATDEDGMHVSEAKVRALRPPRVQAELTLRHLHRPRVGVTAYSS